MLFIKWWEMAFRACYKGERARVEERDEGTHTGMLAAYCSCPGVQSCLIWSGDEPAEVYHRSGYGQGCVTDFGS